MRGIAPVGVAILLHAGGAVGRWRLRWFGGGDRARRVRSIAPVGVATRGKEPERNLMGGEWAWDWDTASVGASA